MGTKQQQIELKNKIRLLQQEIISKQDDIVKLTAELFKLIKKTTI